MGQHRRHHMVVPASIFSYCIGGHPQCSFPFYKTLCNGPPPTPSPHESPSRWARRGLADRVRIHRISPSGPLDHPPDGALGQAFLAERHPVAGKRLGARALRPFGDRALIPTRRWEACCQGRHRAGGVGGGRDAPLRAGLAPRRVALLLRLGPLEPAARVRRHGHHRRHSDTRITGVQKVWALATEASSHQGLARQEPLAHAALQPRRRPRLVLPSTWRASGSIALRASGLHWPTIESKQWARGSLRAKQSCKADGNSHSASMTPATALRTTSNLGMANPSPAVRQAGHMRCLLVREGLQEQHLAWLRSCHRQMSL